jgi:hypothetical protein
MKGCRLDVTNKDYEMVLFMSEEELKQLRYLMGIMSNMEIKEKMRGALKSYDPLKVKGFPWNIRLYDVMVRLLGE